MSSVLMADFLTLLRHLQLNPLKTATLDLHNWILRLDRCRLSLVVNALTPLMMKPTLM